jgi:hypothetical protein
MCDIDNICGSHYNMWCCGYVPAHLKNTGTYVQNYVVSNESRLQLRGVQWQ